MLCAILVVLLTEHIVDLGISKLTKLSSLLAICSYTCPVIRPCLITMCPKGNHGLDGKADAFFTGSNLLVLGIMRNIGWRVEVGVDTVATVCLDDTAVLLFGVLLDHVTEFSVKAAWLYNLNGFVQALSGCFNDADSVWILLGFLANIVSFV